jgi:hypothetical protein
MQIGRRVLLRILLRGKPGYLPGPDYGESTSKTIVDWEDHGTESSALDKRKK